MKYYAHFHKAIEACERDMCLLSYPVENQRWQSRDVKGVPGSKMQELFNTSFTVSLASQSISYYQNDIRPNLPWAENHFLERIAGIPWNPGEQWKHWPWANSADTFRAEAGKFSHTYMERYWPKLAGHKLTDENFKKHEAISVSMMRGIRYAYGDLHDVITLLQDDPGTRQAFLPVWFPEDTGVVHRERVPCTLGYHFLMRHGYLHMTYYIRSCDLTRHFRDDLYLSVRLLLWVLGTLQSWAPSTWDTVRPGQFVFHCASLHCFENDFRELCRNSDTRVES